MHRKVAAALVAALALIVASCGSSEPLTRAELVRQIQVACRDGQREGRQQARRNASQRAQQMAFIDVISVSQHATLDKLDGLEPPDAAKGDFEDFKQGIKERLDLVDQVKAAGPDGIERAMRSASARATALTRDVQAAQRRLGAKGCI